MITQVEAQASSRGPRRRPSRLRQPHELERVARRAQHHRRLHRPRRDGAHHGRQERLQRHHVQVGIDCILSNFNIFPPEIEICSWLSLLKLGMERIVDLDKTGYHTIWKTVFKPFYDINPVFSHKNRFSYKTWFFLPCKNRIPGFSEAKLCLG